MTELVLHDLLWAARRLPRDLKTIMKREGPRVFVAGGFLRSCIANEPVNDVDVFTATKEDAARLAQELAGDHKPYETENAYTVTTRRVSVQFIHRWTFKRPEDAIESFDFTIAKAAIWWHNGTTGWDKTPGWRGTCEDTFYADLAAKRLVYTSPQRNEDAGGSLLRVLKFYQRGYRIPLESMGAVLARLCQGLRWEQLAHAKAGHPSEERALARAITALLREVDPQVDPDAEGHVDTVGKRCMCPRENHNDAGEPGTRCLLCGGLQ